ncbi:MAG: translation initiation factor IF-2 subunit alpha [Thermoproteota archaeon]|jgi:translation initiation factor 2 subunit 1
MAEEETLPSIGSLVVCTATKVLEHGAYFKLDEYKNIEGYMPIGEVSSTRVFDINDVIKVGHRYVCKVIRVFPAKMQVDISLKRVTEKDKRDKLIEWKRKQRALKLIEIVSNKIKYEKEKIIKELKPLLERKFEDLFSIFEALAKEGESVIEGVNLPIEIKKELVSVAKEHIKIPKAEVRGEFSLTSFHRSGVNVIKDMINKAESNLKDLRGLINTEISYLGGGRYLLVITADNYKVAEEAFNKFMSTLSNLSNQQKAIFSFKKVQ